MNDVQIGKKTLIEKIKANRAEHTEVFEKATAGYREAAREWFEEQHAKLKSGLSFDTYFPDTQPLDHTDDYDRALSQLEMDVREVLTLTANEFNQLVLNEWHWAREFTASAVHYLGETGEMPKTKKAWS